MIRSGYYALYHGIEYHLEYEVDSGNAIIFTNDNKKIDKTFVKSNNTKENKWYEKYVKLSELEDAYCVYTYVVVEQGKKMRIEKESAEMYYVFARSEDKDLINKYNLMEEERGVFAGWIYKDGLQLSEEYRNISIKI